MYVYSLSPSAGSTQTSDCTTTSLFDASVTMISNCYDVLFNGVGRLENSNVFDVTSTCSFQRYGRSKPGCNGRNEIFTGVVSNHFECRQKCCENAACTSFEWWGDDIPHPSGPYRFCQVSSSCTSDNAHGPYAIEDWTSDLAEFYVKTSAGRFFFCRNSAAANTNLALPQHSISAATKTDTDTDTETDTGTDTLALRRH